MRYLQSMILAILFVLALILQFTQYGDYDLWWHLRRGQHVYETGHFYTVDTFSYTYAGQPQYCGEWLADLMFFGFYHVGGLVGLNVLKSLIILGTLAFIFLTLQKSFQEKTTGFYATVITILAILFAIRFRLFIRPYIFGYLFFAIYLWLLASFAKERCQWQLYLLPVIQILWSNMSMSAVFGPMLLAFFTLGAMCDRSLRQTIRGLAGIFAITLIASLISPEIYHPYLKIAQATLQTNMGRIGEFQPLSWQLLWGYGWRYTFVYQCLVIGILLYFVCCQGWRQVFHVLLITTFFVESVRHLRMIDFFALSAAPAFMLAVESGLRASWIKRFVERPAGGIALAILLVLLIPVALLHPSYQFGTGVKKDTFPEGALQFLEREKIEGRVFNSYGFGGYIIWNTPQRQVFIDGRHLHLYSHDFLTKYDRMVEDAKTWQEAQAKWGFDYAIVEYDTKTRIFPLHRIPYTVKKITHLRN